MLLWCKKPPRRRQALCRQPSTVGVPSASATASVHVRLQAAVIETGREGCGRLGGRPCSSEGGMWEARLCSTVGPSRHAATGRLAAGTAQVHARGWQACWYEQPAATAACLCVHLAVAGGRTLAAAVPPPVAAPPEAAPAAAPARHARQPADTAAVSSSCRTNHRRLGQQQACPPLLRLRQPLIIMLCSPSETTIGRAQASRNRGAPQKPRRPRTPAQAV